MYIYICISIYICVRVYIYVCIYTYIYTYTCLSIILLPRPPLSTVAAEADFEAVVEFIAVDVEALHQIAMMPHRDCVSTAAALTT